MAVQRGKDLLLKLDDTGTGVYVTVAGLRTRRLAFSEEAVDVTTTESADRWRELLSGAGVRRAHVSGSGVFRDAASDAAVRSTFFAGALKTWQIALPDFGVIQGAFLIAALEFTGAHDGELTFDLTLESAGALTFTAI
ncbi:phage major tail protein, TP901-1 family [Pinisolibacter aquiterrae]|uniref:phage major tail protein, TP901-1 family n=1 Tax=Pinisolibacter aquiterrae TaxID=2815579 RepID=UPI001C3C9E96|nr:phage major tail protein, TP901-1 family [Pinisolibacter aquiterrae]MBV5263172.1 phage major tail protein, TP901-1 family [Pinisolibacter aquiterrae]MCC8234086.1 phage major tail protein, TP901-1 family [Pinisolibacter aquiterrae]